MKTLLLSTALVAFAAAPVLAQDTTTPPATTETAPMDGTTAPDTMTPAPDATTPAPDAGMTTDPAVDPTAPAVDPSVPATDPTMTTDPAMDTMDTTTEGFVPPEGYTPYAGEVLTVEDLQGATVYSSADESISDISDFVLDGEGKITDVILDVGGFLGMGTRSVAIPYADLQIYTDADNNVRIYLPVTREQVEAMPEHTM